MLRAAAENADSSLHYGFHTSVLWMACCPLQEKTPIVRSFTARYILLGDFIRTIAMEPILLIMVDRTCSCDDELYTSVTSFILQRKVDW